MPPIARPRHRSITHRALASTIGRAVAETRRALGEPQSAVAARAGLARSVVSSIEGGATHGVSLHSIALVLDALGIRAWLEVRPPFVVGDHGLRDPVHARAVGHAQRRLSAAGWQVRSEVGFREGRTRGWIDVLAWRATDRRLLVIETKTQLLDIGGVARDLDRYADAARACARRLGWAPLHIERWLLLLATDETDRRVVGQSEVMRALFPRRAADLREIVARSDVECAIATAGLQRGVAMVDPSSRRHEWLVATRSDGRRSPAPYRDYADAAIRAGRRPAR